MKILSECKKIENVTMFKSLNICVTINHSVKAVYVDAMIGNFTVLYAELPFTENMSDNRIQENAVNEAINHIANIYGDHFDFQTMKINQQFDHAVSYFHMYDILSDGDNNFTVELIQDETKETVFKIVENKIVKQGDFNNLAVMTKTNKYSLFVNGVKFDQSLAIGNGNYYTFIYNNGYEDELKLELRCDDLYSLKYNLTKDFYLVEAK